MGTERWTERWCSVRAVGRAFLRAGVRAGVRQVVPLAGRATVGGAALGALLGLAACGGSVAIGIGFDSRGDSRDGDRPPSVSLAVSPDAAAAGRTVRLVAAASDDFGIDVVEFYRLDAGAGADSVTLLGHDGEAPYQLDAALPVSATGRVQFVARAIDGANQRTDSAAVAVTLLP